MAFVGTILQELIKRRKYKKHQIDGVGLQKQELKKLLSKAQNTQIGQKYDFAKILKSDNLTDTFRNQVPVYDYIKMLNEFWYKTKNSEANVTWPGKVKYFGLTSGTSDAASKTVPITSDMIKAIRRTSLLQLDTLSLFDFPASFYEKSVLTLGGSTTLVKVDKHYEGDLSGIMQKSFPLWFSKFYKPGKKINEVRDWGTKLQLITENAHKWDIGIIAGVPAWCQILIEKVIKHNNAKNIHEVWPNLQLYIHGGVSFAPYKESFKKLMGKEIQYLETYLASEGFIAFRKADENAMQLVLNNGMYYEFVPFNSDNFDSEGNFKENPKVLSLNEVIECEEYALLVSTCAGAWRYLIGDTIKFTSLKDFEIVITGRTKHFLSLCGEHLSVDNMTKAVQLTAKELNISVNEYTVQGIRYESLFAHQWYIGCDQSVDNKVFAQKLDANICSLNDDYAVERKEALRNVLVEIVPTQTFYSWMKLNGREGSQNKFPRVLKKEQFVEWESFVNENK